MRQVLFEIPLQYLAPSWPDLPIYGYGMMLFLAFVFCLRLAKRLAGREGFTQEQIQDLEILTIWIFVTGIFRARVTYALQYHVPITQFFAVWDGGLVFYGSAIGGTIGYLFVHFFYLRRHQMPIWKMLDVIAPCVALGLALGRIGCLLNGCCYGNVAVCEDGMCPAISFPLSAAPRLTMTSRGYQTAAGFTLDPQDANVVGVVESGSNADAAGLRPGDRILTFNGVPLDKEHDIHAEATAFWKRGVNTLTLTVRHADDSEESLAFSAWTVGIHPTQIYETISMVLMLFFLLSYYAFKVRDGSVMVLFMLGYAVHRFLNEMLRTDTDPVAFGMTLSQNISIVVLVAGVILGLVVFFRSQQGIAPALAEGDIEQ